MNVLLNCLEKECNVIFVTLCFSVNALCPACQYFCPKDLVTPITCTVESWYKDHLWAAPKVVFTLRGAEAGR